LPTDWNGGIIRAAGESGLWLKVDASRRRNDPHKRGKVPVSMVRLRCKSCRAAFKTECGARVAVVGGVKLSSEPTDRRVWGQKPGQPTPCAKIQKGVLYQMFEDKVLVCKDCGQEFTFTAGEQEFYAEHGFQNEPQRCKPCRDARKNAARGPRQFFTATCANCGGEARVPFEPKSDRPVYCSNCFAQMRGE
jgi:CxxC-x17-CxxC domain-containing protein